MKKITITEIARELGLSISTVSRALQDSYEIGEDTKQVVKEYARKVNYFPNAHAQGLRQQVSKTIAVIIPDIANYFFTLALNGIEEFARANKYHILIYQTHDDCEKELEIINHLRNGRVDGVLVSLSFGLKNNLQHFEDLNKIMPVVFFDRIPDLPSIAAISCDDEYSSYKAVEHLIKKGCSRIVFIGISDTLSVTMKRLAGYEKALKNYQITSMPQHKIFCKNEQEAAMKIEAALKNGSGTLGIFSTVERYTLIVYANCAKLGLKIPTDVKIISFSNSPFAAFLQPALSTVSLPAYAIGENAAMVLFQKLKKKNDYLYKSSIELKCELVFRESSGG